MAGITNLNCYPKGISTYTFDVCIICVKGLLKSIANPDLGYYHFNDGYIRCYVYERYESFIHIDCFSEEFDSLAHELWENSGDDEEFVTLPINSFRFLSFFERKTVKIGFTA